MKHNKHGFTLVEIMVVVSIIAILAAVALPNLMRGRITANNAAAKSTLKAISTALENYSMIEGRYPTTTTVLLGETPPYLNVDFFNDEHNGFTFVATTLQSGSYLITAAPTNPVDGTTTFTLVTGGVISEL